MIEIPIPRMARDQALVIASQPVEHPVSRSYVLIVVRPVDSFRRLLVPARPSFPVHTAVVVVGSHLVGLIIEETLSYAIAVRSVFGLQSTPQHPVDEPLKFIDFLFVGLDELLHDRCQPGTRATLVAQPCYPRAAVLEHHAVGLTVISDHGRSTVERVARIDKPLACSQKVSQVCDGLRSWFYYEVLDGLYGSVAVGNRYPRAPPRIAMQCISSPVLVVRRIYTNFNGRGRFNFQRSDGLAVFEEQTRLDILRQHVSWHAKGDRSPTVGQRGLYMPDRVGD